jgi:hypothetical protein
MIIMRMTDGDQSTPKCSSKILVPIPIRIKPPKISALLSKSDPNFFPIKTAITHKANVTNAITVEAVRMSLCKKGRNEKNERLKPLENFATMRVCKGLSKMSFKKAVKVAQIVKV